MLLANAVLCSHQPINILSPPACPPVQPAAEAFGAKCNIDSKYIVNFGEEVVRGQSVFVLSLLLAQLEPQIRQAAGAGNWQVSKHRDDTCQQRGVCRQIGVTLRAGTQAKCCCMGGFNSA